MKQLKDPPAFSWSTFPEAVDEGLDGVKPNRRMQRRMRILGSQPLRKRPRTRPEDAQSELVDWAEGKEPFLSFLYLSCRSHDKSFKSNSHTVFYGRSR